VSAYEPVLAFWFGPDADDAAVARRQALLWWSGRPEDDAAIRDRFRDTHWAAVNGELDPWLREPPGRLALIIVADQFSRAMFRGTPQAFAHDALARQWVLDGLAAGDDAPLRPIQRVFYSLPLQHSESREHQQRSVAYLEALIEATPSLRPTLEGYLDYARRHRDIVERFGRFPHRNAVLGRATTPEEQAFLDGGGFAG